MKIRITHKKDPRWVLRGKKNRLAGDRMEMKLLRSHRDASHVLASCRSAGSHGLFDNWTLQKDKLRLIVAKTNGYLDKRERRELIAFMAVKPDFVQVEVHYYVSPKKMGKTIIKKASHIRPMYK